MSESIVPRSSLRPNDVLLGRGNGAINYTGNVAFRALVATRRAEYASAVTETSATNRGGKTAKARIADEVMQCVLTGTGYDTGVEPGLPGRFLKQASAAVLAGAGLDGEQSDTYWIECTRSEALTKVKMALRQIDRKDEHKEARRVAREGGAVKNRGRKQPAAEGGASAAKRPKANPDHGKPAQAPAGAAGAASTVTAADANAYALPLMAGNNGVASLGVGSLMAPGLFPPPADPPVLLASMNNPSSTAVLQALMQRQQLQQQLLINGLIGSFPGSSRTGNMFSVLPAAVAGSPNLELVALSAATPNAPTASSITGSTAGAAPAAAAVNMDNPLHVALRAASQAIVGPTPTLTSFVSKAFNVVSGMVVCHNQGHSFGSVLDGNATSHQASTNAEGMVSGEVIRSDLVAFGSLLYKELTGEPPEGDRSTSELYEQLLNQSFPVPICILVACLLDSAQGTIDDPPYLTADEVEKDLKFLMENHHVLADSGAEGDAKSIWNATRENNLWGRSEEMTLLMDVFKRVVEDGGPLGTAFITGQSGTGKTAMVGHLREPLRKKNGGLISIKFEELGQKLPLSLVFEALDQYCIDLLEGDAVRLTLSRKTLSETLGDSFNPLYQLLPNLRGVLNTSACSSTGDDDIGGVEGELALNRILVLVRTFISAIACPEHPVVLVADDLQWSDEPSLHLISMILSDTSNCLLFIGIYRDDEVGPGHVLTGEVEKWNALHVPTVDIRIGNLDLDIVNEMLACRLKLLPHLTRTLAEIVTQKTDANPLFINELLQSLCSDKLITYSEHERRWKWDDTVIQGRGVADNVVELICGQLRQLAVESQKLLMNAACLGSQSEESSLRLLWGQDSIDFSLNLALLVTEGWLCKVNEAPARFSFSHDRVQEAVYARLIPAGERTAMHLNIARKLEASGLSKDQRVYTVVDQYVRARDLVVDRSERIKVARLCLDAGTKASLAAAFSLSSWCLSQGVQFLIDSDWESEYQLCLGCYSKCAISQHIIGENSNALKSLESVFKNGKTLLDTMESSLTFLEIQSAQGKFEEALESGLELLAQLGQSFPPNPSQSDIVEEFSRVESLRKSTNIPNLMEKEIEDPIIVATAKALTVLERVAFRQNQTYFALFGLRGAELTLKSGTCLESTVSFAAMAMLQLQMQRFDEARELARFSLDLLERKKSTLYLPRVYAMIYSSVFPLLEPLQTSREQLRRGYQVGIKMGDAGWGIYSGYCFFSVALRTGNDLQTLHNEVRQLQSHAMAFNHELATPVRHLIQVLSNLCDPSILDPTSIMPEIPTREIVGEEPPEGIQGFVHLSQIYFFRLFLSYLFGKNSQAYDVVMATKSFLDKVPVRNNIIADEKLYTGLTAVAIAREKGDDKLMEQARECAEKLKVFATRCSHNFEHKQRLLEAEIAVFDCKYDEAASLYDDTIRIAGENGFIHEQGLAHEKAGSFYFGLDRSKSIKHFECAKKCFLQWGSPNKVRDLEQRYSLEASK